jgi:hypothetical protein
MAGVLMAAIEAPTVVAGDRPRVTAADVLLRAMAVDIRRRAATVVDRHTVAAVDTVAVADTVAAGDRHTAVAADMDMGGNTALGFSPAWRLT